jgi:hypothetical protein
VDSDREQSPISGTVQWTVSAGDDDTARRERPFRTTLRCSRSTASHSLIRASNHSSVTPPLNAWTTLMEATGREDNLFELLVSANRDSLLRRSWHETLSSTEETAVVPRSDDRFRQIMLSSPRNHLPAHTDDGIVVVRGRAGKG